MIFQLNAIAKSIIDLADKNLIQNKIKECINIHQFSTFQTYFYISTFHNNQYMCIIIDKYLLQINLKKPNEYTIIELNLLQNNDILSGNFLFLNDNLHFCGSLANNGGIIMNLQEFTYQLINYGVINSIAHKNELYILNEANQNVKYVQTNGLYIEKNIKKQLYINTIQSHNHYAFILNDKYVSYDLTNNLNIFDNDLNIIWSKTFDNVMNMHQSNNCLYIITSRNIYVMNELFKCINTYNGYIDNYIYTNNKHVILSLQNVIILNDLFEEEHVFTIQNTKIISILPIENSSEIALLYSFNNSNIQMITIDLNKYTIKYYNININLYYKIFTIYTIDNKTYIIYLSNLNNLICIII